MALPALLLLVVAAAAMEAPELESWWVRREAAATGVYHSSTDEVKEAAALGKFDHASLAAIQALDPDGPRLLPMPEDGTQPPECANTTCFRKCCPPGYTRQNDSCSPYNVTFDPLIVSSLHSSLDTNLTDWDRDDYYLVIGRKCSGYWFSIDWAEVGAIVTYPELFDNGSLIIYEYYKKESKEETKEYGILAYCAEYSEEGTSIAYVCLDRTLEAGAFDWIYTFGLVVSVLGLLLTLAVYVAVDSLRDLHGKALVGHVGTLAVAYMLLVAVQMSEDGDFNFNRTSCRGFAFAIHFFLLSSFFWLHVMCIDALWGVLHATGCSPVPYPRAKKWKWLADKRFWAAEAVERDEKSEANLKEEEKNLERRVFVLYCIYVSCLSILPVLLASVQDLRPTIPATYLDYNMKLHHCPFDNDKPSLKYFFSIVGAIEFVNIIIFMVILVKACRFQWNTTGPQRVPKQKARMCFILFLLMSSNWITDIISWAIDGNQNAWIVLHAFNIFEGLITFCIFVLEDRVKDCIKRKWPQLKFFKRMLRCCNDEPRDVIENPEERTVMLHEVRIAHSQYK